MKFVPQNYTVNYKTVAIDDRENCLKRHLMAFSVTR